MDINPSVFKSKRVGTTSVQDGVMSDLQDFLKTVPPGTQVHIPTETSAVLNALGQALGNIVAGEVAKFNQRPVLVSI